MANRKAFPSRVFVKRENEGDEEEYLSCSEEPEAMVEVGESPVIAEYRLVRAHKVKVVVNWPE